MDFQPREELKPELNIVTLVDVVLLLLIFFMLTTNFVLQSGIEIKLPQAAPTKVESKQELTITVTKENELYLNQKKITFAQLPAALQALLKDKPGKTKSGESKKLLIMRADKEVLHGTVVKIMDLAKRLGVETLAIATEASP